MTTTTAILDTTKLMLAEGCVYELRILNTRKGTVSGYFDDFSKLAEAAAEWNGKAPAIYVTLNPANPELLARSTNHLTEYARHTTADSDIVRRCWLPIDCDPVRPSGISSTDAEHEEAIARAKKIDEWLREQGWPRPVWADSGNGGHLLYRIDLPNDQDSTAIIQRCLEALDLRFSDDTVTVDVKNYNAARIWKLYGTTAAKGDSTPERPHRVSSILYAPPDLQAVNMDLLKQLAAGAPPPEAKGGRRTGSGDFNLERWIEERGLQVARTSPWQGGQKWILAQCPWDPSHTDNAHYIVQFPSGAIAAGCHHNGCAGKDWRALRELLEPHAGPKHEPRPPSDNSAAPESPVDGRFPRTDAGNGELFAHLYGDRVRFDHRRKRWLLWAEHWWIPDTDAAVRRTAKAATRRRYQIAAAIDDLGEREREARWAISSESRMRMDAMLFQGASEKPIADSGEDWDSDPWIVGVANGVVDLKTGGLRGGRQEDRITMHSPVAYDPDATCPRWEQFLLEVFAGAEDLVDYIWRACGYTLTGITREQCLFLCYGTGWNGKTKFRTVQEDILGDYAANTPFSTFEFSGRSSITNDLAALHHKRIVTASELSEGRRLNEARLKMFAGEDPVTARFLYAENFTFWAVAKLWLSFNHKPVVRDDSTGFWRKVCLIPFAESFKGRADKNLDNALRREYPGILAWMVRGCLQWQNRGLEPPDVIRAVTEEYRAESDPLADFVNEACAIKPEASVKASRLYKCYKEWAEDTGLSDRERLTSTRFGTAMGERFTKHHTKHGWFYDGVLAG